MGLSISTNLPRDSRFKVNDEIINVNGSSLRGLTMEQVITVILTSPPLKLLNLKLFKYEDISKHSCDPASPQARNVLKNTAHNVDIIIARSPEGENFPCIQIHHLSQGGRRAGATVPSHWPGERGACQWSRDPSLPRWLEEERSQGSPRPAAMTLTTMSGSSPA